MIDWWLVYAIRDIFGTLVIVEYTETVKEVKIVSENVLGYCPLGFSIIFIINIGTGVYFVYYKYMNHNKENIFKYDYIYLAKNY